MRGAVLYGPGDVRREIDPGQVFDLTLPLDQVAEGYRARTSAARSSPCSCRRARAVSAGQRV